MKKTFKNNLMSHGRVSALSVASTLSVASIVPLAVLPAVALADERKEHEHGYPHVSKHIEEVIVTSTATDRPLSDLAQEITVLQAEELARQNGSTLGELLDGTTGISNASFGPGVGRPVIRGLSGKRVKVMQNGTDAADLSATSSDHAVMVDPVSAEQIEIIKGPATLLYGGGAIGGVVNLVKTQIHKQPMSGIQGSVSARLSTLDDGQQVTGALDLGTGPLVLHVEGFDRESDDYRVGDNSRFGDKALNSDVKADGGNVALSWVVEDQGYIGLSYSLMNYDYGVPNAEDEDERVTPEQHRYQLKTGWTDLIPGIHEWETEYTYTDYKHEERHDVEVAGLFEQESHELKTVFSHHPLTVGGREFNGSFGLHLVQTEVDVCHSHDGCPDIPDFSNLPWDGSQGLNLIEVGGYLFNHDNPMASTETQDIGVFWVEDLAWSQGVLEFGVRYDSREISADPNSIRPAYRLQQSEYRDRSFNLFSFSAAGTWNVDDRNELGLNLAQAQRAPEDHELFWNGEHHATFSYQQANGELEKETAYTASLNWLHSRQTLETGVTAYYYLFDDYVYNTNTGLTDSFEGLPVYHYQQRDAYFTGAELSVHWDMDEHAQGLNLDVLADIVKARLLEGDNRNIPRTPPASLTGTLNWQGDWQAWQLYSGLSLRYTARQNQLAENETVTDAYSTVNLQVSAERKLGADGDSLMLSLKGNNLTDEYGQNHVSYLKQQAPIAGRHLIAELSYRF